ncbi:MAG: hypothetical protein HYZ29_30145 [Myxococcales bacterium]|nr:hypothetical protein [Myxococcales bacterium]
MVRAAKVVGVVLAGALSLAAYACGGDDSDGGGSGTGGSGGTGGKEGGTCGPTPLGFPGTCKSGAPEECCGTTLPVMQKRDKNDKLIAPDWSCLTGGGGSGGTGGSGMGGSGGSGGADSGTADSGTSDAGDDSGTSDAGGDGGTVSDKNKFAVLDFSSDKGVADIEVDLFEGETIFGKTPFFSDFTKGVSHHAGETGLNIGEFYFPHPAEKYLSYRVKEKPGVAKEFVGFGYAVPAVPGKVDGATLTPDMYEQLSTAVVTLAGWTPPEDLAIITGPIRDCAGDDVGGARIKFFDETANGEVEPGTCERDVRYVYFDGSLPNVKCAYTDYRQSLFVIANAPSNAPGQPKAGNKYRIEYWGRLSESDAEPVKFAQKSVEIFANTVNVHQIRPNVPKK